MDPISGLFVLLILIAFAYGMYLAYQKFVVDGGLFQTPEQTPVQTTTPVVSTASASEVPGVKSLKGRPNSSAVFAGNPIHWYGGNEKLIKNGRAKTASACYEASKARGINNWGWDKINKSCYAYVDSNILTAMDVPTNIEGPGQYVSGCTEPGVSPANGCLNYLNRDIVKGNVSGGQHILLGGPMSFEQCRQNSRDGGYDSFLYTTNRYGGTCCSTQCRGEANSEVTRGFTGNSIDVSHITACVDPSKKVADACM